MFIDILLCSEHLVKCESMNLILFEQKENVYTETVSLNEMNVRTTFSTRQNKSLKQSLRNYLC